MVLLEISLKLINYEKITITCLRNNQKYRATYYIIIRNIEEN